MLEILRERFGTIVVVIAVLGGGAILLNRTRVNLTAVATGGPVQTSPSASSLPAPPGYTITATDDYEVEALVVSTKRYSSGHEGTLSPVDFALVWGPLSDEPNLSQFEYWQRGRWYYYKYPDRRKLTVSEGEIISNSANTHIVIPPDKPELGDAALAVKAGQRVHLRGHLVSVAHESGWRWKSSRTRNDTGNGSCEVLYLTALEVR